jgi:signal transduction histidine kinase/CheY-like chemotaxis protein
VGNATSVSALALLSTGLVVVAAALVIGLVVGRALARRARPAEPPAPPPVTDESRAARLDALLVARMSHDLRSPLNSVVTLSELLRDGNAGPLSIEQRRYVDVIRHSGQALLGLINDVLELAALESGRVELEAGPVDLVALAHQIAESVAPVASDKGIPLHVVAAEPPLCALTDGEELRRIVQRLVEHALAETSNGYVEIEVGRAPDRRALVRVHETSEPLTDGALEALTGHRGDFESFVAGEAGFSGRGPAALPLVLAARLAGALGVRIGVESTPTDGVTFELELPLVEVAAEAAAVVPPTAPASDGEAGGHVLLIEDDAFERQRVRELLQSAGYDVSLAGSGGEGLELLRARHFDAVVLDLVMPGMSGLDVLRAARADDRLSDVPFIVLSALYMTKSERAVLGPKVASVVRKGDATAAELARSLRLAIKRRPDEAHPAPGSPGGAHA